MHLKFFNRRIKPVGSASVYIPFFLFFGLNFGAQIEISGKVTGPNGQALVGATVTLQNSKLSTVTNADGNFSLAGTVNINGPKQNTLAEINQMKITGRKISFWSAKELNDIKIKLNDLSGKVLYKKTVKNVLYGENSIELPKGLNQSSLNLLSFQINNKKILVYKLPFSGFPTGLTTTLGAKVAKLGKSEATALDTLKVAMGNYINERVAITQFNSVINVALKNQLKDSNLVYPVYQPKAGDIKISRSTYIQKLYGFWLGQCIANWTGLVTEMDKIGDVGDIKTGAFYTREDWGKPDKPSIWGQGVPSNLSPTIDFVFRGAGDTWGSDDDTDIEYIYQHILHTNKASLLTAEQIKSGWLTHIYSEKAYTPYGKDHTGNYENFLWVSNQTAYTLMEGGMLPPQTGRPPNNNEYNMIDAQLTTEIFGLFAPVRTDVALKMSNLPIRTTAYEDAAYISDFYVVMHSLASSVSDTLSMKEKITWMANEARKVLPNESYAAKMFDFVKAKHGSGIKWEHARDSVYVRYQVNQKDGYNLTSKNLYCNGCFAAGINFAASIVSLLYGEGNIVETIKIGALCGWDSDNPTATWGGMLGFMIGKKGVETAFNRTFSDKYNIHRTRRNFPNNGINTFDKMAETGMFVVDRAVIGEMKGGVDLAEDVLYIPQLK